MFVRFLQPTTTPAAVEEDSPRDAQAFWDGEYTTSLSRDGSS